MKYVNLLNDKAFTMMEMLLSLAMFLTLVTLLPVGLRVVLSNGVMDSGVMKMEWSVFSEQMKKEIRSADQLTIRPDKLLLKKQGKVILYEKYGNSIRRRVDYTGHEILFQNLEIFHFEKLEKGVALVATDLNGNVHTVRVHYYVPLGEVTP